MDVCVLGVCVWWVCVLCVCWVCVLGVCWVCVAVRHSANLARRLDSLLPKQRFLCDLSLQVSRLAQPLKVRDSIDNRGDKKAANLALILCSVRQLRTDATSIFSLFRMEAMTKT